MNNKLNFTFLTKEQVFGKDRLDIFNIYDAKCSATDFSILLGIVGNVETCTDESRETKNINGIWWTKLSEDDEVEYSGTYMVDKNGLLSRSRCELRCCGARPSIPYSEIKPFCINETINDKGIKEVLYGEYPQTVVSNKYSYEIEKAYNNDSLNKTGKKYTTDSVNYDDEDIGFEPRELIEYEYKGEKYIRFVADLNCDGETLSDGREIKAGKVYWIKVEPIAWLVDEKTNIAFSKNILFAGVQFDNNEYYFFEETIIKKFMDEYFSKEIEMKNQKKLSNKKANNTQSISEKTKKPDKFNNKEVFEQDNLEELNNLKKKIKQLDEELKQIKEEIKPLQELREAIVSLSHNQKVYTNSEKRKSK